uniref:Uncharacterized protein n=1 Tax=Rhizophora mucronata TaxID=61149 RepID=A0A2P2NNC8_RHIMU
MAAQADMLWPHLLGMLLIQVFAHGISIAKMYVLFIPRMEEPPL